MTTIPSNPPTKILSTRPISPSEAHSLLSSFLASAATNPHLSQQDLLLADQRRIAQALDGVYDPKPLPEAEVYATDAAEGKKRKEKKVTEEGQEQQDVEMGDVEMDADVGLAGPEAVTKGGIDKVKRKAEKKARMAEEKRKRAEARLKEKEAEAASEE